MDEQDVRTRLTEIGLTEDQMNEVVPLLVQPTQEPAINSGRSAAIESAKQALTQETDWRKKAALAARIISLELDA